MAILSTLTLNNGLAIYTVDADPTITGVSAPAGSIIIWQGTNSLYIKGTGGDTDWNETALASDVVTYTSSNGITKTGNNFALGGTLTGTTSINVSTQTISVGD